MGIPAVFSLILHNGGNVKLLEGDLELACMKDRMGEDFVECDIFVTSFTD